MTATPVDSQNGHENGYVIDTRHERLDLATVHRWLSTDIARAAGRSREVVDRAAAGAIDLGADEAGGAQVAYARVVTDRATFGWLCACTSRRSTRFYERAGFVPFPQPEKLMILGPDG